MRARELSDGVQVLQAWFAGHGFDKHRHDTYAIGLTDVGVQAFDYRGVTEISTPGKIVVLHPDEPHDGRAGTPDDGFGYRIVYVAPARIGEAARAIGGGACALPFVRHPVAVNDTVARTIGDAFCHQEPLAIDDVVLRLAEALLGCRSVVRWERDASSLRRQGDRPGATVPGRRDDPGGSVHRARGGHRAHAVRARPAVSHWPSARARIAYSLLRRLDRARAQLGRSRSLADVALDTGFADQAHFSRMFKAAFGITPARCRALATGSGA